MDMERKYSEMLMGMAEDMQKLAGNLASKDAYKPLSRTEKDLVLSAVEYQVDGMFSEVKFLLRRGEMEDADRMLGEIVHLYEPLA
jgi:hypothetical protein